MSTEPQVQFPLGSFKDAAPHLRRPFTPEAIKFKVQATWPKDSPTGGLIVGYIDARLVVERLNMVIPHAWGEEFQALGAKHLLCRLTVDGITRQDIGEGEGKGLYSDALKRAAVKFGVGVSIYAIPKMILEVKTGQLKTVDRGGKKTCEMTSDGEKTVRSIYAKWLEGIGKRAFGEPLDHGDVEDAQGDYEAEIPTPTTSGEGVPVGARVLTVDERAKVLKAIKDAGHAEDGLAMLLTAAGAESPESLTTAHAFEIRALLDRNGK